MPAIARLGIPLALQSASVGMSKLFVISYINSYGVIISAITGMGQKISQCALIIADAVQSSCSSIIGQNFGAGKLRRIKLTVYCALMINFAFAMLFSAILLLYPRQIYRIFSKEAKFIAIALTYTPVAVIGIYGLALRSPMLSLINGLGRSILTLAAF